MEANYYVIVQNRFYFQNEDNFHLEKIFSKEEVIDIIENEIFPRMEMNNFIFKYHPLLVTNDVELLSKYIFALSIDDVKMLSKAKDHNKEYIRISKSIFYQFNLPSLFYLQRIIDNELISANEFWTSYTLERVELGYGNYEFHENTLRGDLIEEYGGWEVNKNFFYFKTPIHYSALDNVGTIFKLDTLQKWDIQTFKNILNLNISEDKEIPWEPVGNYCLRFFDKVSKRKLYVFIPMLEKISKDAEFEIETTLDKEHYITYFLTGVRPKGENFRRYRHYGSQNIGYPPEFPEYDDYVPSRE